MEYEKIRELMKDMGESKLKEVNIDFPDGTKISMKKEVQEVNVDVSNKSTSTIYTESVPKENENTKHLEEGKFIKSPMVGTFYLKPSPTDKPYVEIGQNVQIGDTLCIIEAMKLMNEIESEYSGKIKEILVKDGEAVEYGTKLFSIE